MTAPILSPTVRDGLLTWYEQTRRIMPWRESRDPYAIWVSEIMLQQTQVVTVIPYYQKWMSTFPTVDDLANAEEDQILACWQGLGYYRRCRLLQLGAKFVQAHGFPVDAQGWRNVPGVGPYTAGAISSIAFNAPEAVVDGNVARVYSRISTDESTGLQLEKKAWIWARRNLNQTSPGDWNQALMELGATICKPRVPNCSTCPLASECVANIESVTTDFPRSLPKQKPINLVHTAIIPTYKNLFGVEQIPPGEWWEGMWRFPKLPPGQISPNLVRETNSTGTPIGVISHTVTKHRIRLEVTTQSFTEPVEKFRWLSPAELEEIPMPTPQRKAFALLTHRHPNLFDKPNEE